MNTRKQQSGFSVFELLLVVVVIAAVGFAGWWVYHDHHKTTTAASTSNTASQSQSPVASNVSSAPAKISSTSDLDKALQILNQNDPSTANASDNSQLSSQASGF